LKEINLRFNTISDEGTQYISDALKTKTTLKEIDLENIKISTDLIISINQQLGKNW
jgi:hypothetical protein